jgi:hypothetical protein
VRASASPRCLPRIDRPCWPSCSRSDRVTDAWRLRRPRLAEPLCQLGAGCDRPSVTCATAASR